MAGTNQNLTAVPVFTDPVPAPVDTYDITADRNNVGDSPQNPANQALTNRTAYVRPGAEQDLGESLVPRVRMYWTLTTCTLIGLGEVCFWTNSGQTTTGWGLHGTTSIASTGLTVNTWYYFYITYSGGTPSMLCSTTAPDQALCFMQGDPTKRYVGCNYVFSDTGAVPHFWTGRQSGNHLVWQYDFSGPSSFAVLVNGLAGTGGWVTLSALNLPPYVRVVDLAALLATSQLSSDSLFVRRVGTGDSRLVATAGASSQQTIQSNGVGLSSAGTVTVTRALAGDTVATVFDVTGSGDITNEFDGTVVVNGQLQQHAVNINGHILLVTLTRHGSTEGFGIATVETDENQQMDYQAATTTTINLVMVGLYH